MTALTLYPAIDLKDGACVRLRRGAMDQATVYSADPAAQARAWQDAGFAWLHVVDLNGAFAGRPVNADAVAAILAAVTHPGAARRRHPRHGRHRGLARRRRAPRHPGQRRGEDPDAGAGRLPRLSRPHRRRHRRARRHRRDRGLGRDLHDAAPSIWRCDSRTPASPRSSTPTSAATAC